MKNGLVRAGKLTKTLSTKDHQQIFISGVTGSIGTSTLKIVDKFPERFSVFGVSVFSRIEDLAKIVLQYRPKVAVVGDQEGYLRLKSLLPQEILAGLQILVGQEGLNAAVSEGCIDTVVCGVVGLAALPSVLSALNAGKRLALANKESIVSGAALLKKALDQNLDSEIIPVDSEHSALFQCLLAVSENDLSELILTASGGPFLNRKRDQLADVTPELAKQHPRWSMGAKISIDSATMVNKALELIEAHWLFGVPEDRISVVVHPQSIVHSLIELNDGALLAQLGVSDMQGPIGFALSYPDNRLSALSQRLKLTEVARLDFLNLDTQRFPAVGLARSCVRAGGVASLVFNSANELAVDSFCKGQLAFSEIESLIESALEQFAGQIYSGSLEDLTEIDKSVRVWCAKKTKILE